ncbi:MAG: cupin domain-containing protein [Panacagrimonas sp.]
MQYFVPEQLHADRRLPVIVHADALEWTPSPQAGVERRFLERQGGEIARATSIVRYAAGSTFPEHVHEKGEEFLVLSGVFSDQVGHFPAGSYVRNPPGSRHAPFTREGCTIFVKLRQMDVREQEALARFTEELLPMLTGVEGLSRLPLFEDRGSEIVHIERLDPGTRWTSRRVEGGEELLVLEGSLSYGDAICPAMTWLRIPQGYEQSITSAAGCRYWVKRGHLPP